MAGRPTAYKPEFCQMLIEHMAKGLSFESFGATINVSAAKLYEYADKHPEFREAKQQGRIKSMLFWENLGVENILSTSETIRKGNSSETKSKTLNAAIYKLHMANKFGWHESKSIEERKTETRLVINTGSDKDDE
jgi:hypothetical protein